MPPFFVRICGWHFARLMIVERVSGVDDAFVVVRVEGELLARMMVILFFLVFRLSFPLRFISINTYLTRYFQRVINV